MKGTTFSTPNSTFRKTTLTEINWQDADTLTALLDNIVGLCQVILNTWFAEQTQELAGQKNQHHPEYQRWGSNPGSVRLNGMRLPLDVPRIRHKESQKTQNLPLYQEIKKQQYEDIEEQVMQNLLKGLSTRDYDGVLGSINEHFGLSASSISRKAQEGAKEALKRFLERDLSNYKFVGLLIDGKYLAKQQMVVALGVTLEGHKIPIGLIQTSTENHLAIKGLLQDIIGRGFNFSSGILCIIDGAKGLYKAVKEVFDGFCLVQRCRWHKRENVLGYLSDEDRPYYKVMLENAYRSPGYEEAKSKLLALSEELRPKNSSAANALLEGLEETLTLHKLGMNIIFGKYFGTTNAIENVNSLLEKQLRNVKHWQDSDQRLRWVASALEQIEPRLRRLPHAEQLAKLQETIKRELHLT